MTDQFSQMVQEVKKEGVTFEMTPKELLNHFYCEKRTSGNTWFINDFLKKNNLEVVPNYETSYMYAIVTLKHKEKARINKSTDETKNSSVHDPINRINLLPSANTKPITINRDADLTEAITLMMLHDYSQLPVMNNDRDVDGILTWKSIGQRLVHQSDGKKVKDFMSKDIDILSYDTPLFNAITIIIEKEVVLVKHVDNCIKGLITATDINEHYLKLTGPFLLLKEIENHIRKILDDKFTLEELRELASSPDNNKEILSISDLTFGEYIRIMENPEKWGRLGLSIDKKTFTARLDKIRIIRNNVMHFHPDGITDSEAEILRETSLFFFRLSEIV